MPYQKPIVIDYGNLIELTQATINIGTEDGGNKFDTDNHHSVPQ